MAVIERAESVGHGARRRGAGDGGPPGCVWWENENGVPAVVWVTGRGDTRAVAALSDSFQRLITAGERHLVVDLAGTYDVDRRLLTLLARTRALLATRFAVEGSLHVVGVVVPQFYAAMRDGSPDEVFVVYDALRRAVTGKRDVTRMAVNL